MVALRRLTVETNQPVSPTFTFPAPISLPLEPSSYVTALPQVHRAPLPISVQVKEHGSGQTKWAQPIWWLPKYCGEWMRPIQEYLCFRSGTVMEEGRVAYNYITNKACFKCFACVAWQESLADSDELLVVAMRLLIDGIKDASEKVLRPLVKR